MGNLLNIPSIYHFFILIINFIIASGVFVLVRYLSGVISNANVTKELAEKDNPAFGLAVTGSMLGVAIMLSGVVAGEASQSFLSEIQFLFIYAFIGLCLMAVTHFVFDKISLPSFSVSSEIKNGNMAAAILDSSNVIATAIIVRNVIIWVDDISWTGITTVLVGFLLSQIVLTAASFYRLKIYNHRHEDSLQDAFERGHTALALRFSGYRIGVAFAITAASSVINYVPDYVFWSVFLWFGLSAALMFLMSFMFTLAEKYILHGIHCDYEVEAEENAAIGFVQGGLFIAMGLFLAHLF